MKRLFFIILSVISVISAFAQLDGTGYYRVKNYGTNRYIYVCDGYSSGINMSTTSVDMGAVQTWTDLNKAITDPASVIYIQAAGSNWDLKAQGTSVHSLIGYYVDIQEKSHSDNIYEVSATVSGQTLYLFDGETSSSPRGRLTTGAGSGSSALQAKYRKWQIFGLNQTDNYVAIAPTLSNGGKYYAPYYVSFPFSFYSAGMKAYYIKKVDAQNKLAVIAEVTGVVPSSTPVIVECSSNSAENNKLNLESYEGYNNRPSDNVLGGVYFSNQYRESPVAYRVYDKNTMRVLGTTSSGKLGYVTATNDMLHNCGDSDGAIWCLPANQSYLPVSADCPSELTIVTEEEYEELCNIPVSSISFDKTSITAHVGETVQLIATVLPENATNKVLEWKSSDESVVTVVDGLLSMKKLGTATITATTTDGTNISASCSVTVEPIKAQSITIDPASLELVLGETATVNYTITPDNTTTKEVVWSSSNTDVVTVENGVITAVGVGTADVTVETTDGSNLSAICKVTCLPILVSQITLDKSELTLDVNATAQLTATISPENATNKQLQWESSDETVATVNSTGLVTAINGGTANVMVLSTDGSNVSASCAVVVISVDGIATIDIEKCPEDCVFYSISGQLLPSVRKGLVIVRYPDGKYAKVMVK